MQYVWTQNHMEKLRTEYKLFCSSGPSETHSYTDILPLAFTSSAPAAPTSHHLSLSPYFSTWLAPHWSSLGTIQNMTSRTADVACPSGYCLSTDDAKLQLPCLLWKQLAFYHLARCLHFYSSQKNLASFRLICVKFSWDSLIDSEVFKKRTDRM